MTEKEVSILEKEFYEDVKQLFPYIQFATSSYWSGDKVDSFGGLKIEFAVKQDVLNGSSYQINGTKNYVHYTSPKALFSILHSGEILLSDLNNLNDPKEFDYLINQYQVKIQQDQINLFKKSLFVFSMCEYDEAVKDDFNMWRLYGDNGNGVGIIFELVNDTYDWYNFIVGRVNYDNPNSEAKLCELLKVVHSYQLKGVNTSRFSALIGMLLLFHKNSIWAIEKEVRIITFCEYDPDVLSSKGTFSDPHFGTEKLSFFINFRGFESANISHKLEHKIAHEIDSNLYLNEEQKQKCFRNNLRLRIKKIILGYNVSEDYLEKLQDLLIKLIHRGLPHISVEHSKWRDTFKT
jgi:hypothetical protein